MNTNLTYHQHGDCLLAKVDQSTLPNDLVLEMSKTDETKPNLVIAEGEGHHEHVFVGGAVRIMQSPSTKERFVVVDKDTSLEHLHIGSSNQAEHKPQALYKGTYKFGQVLEFDPFTQFKRTVVD